MVEWLVPVSLYWTLAALYFGGGSVDIRGGGARQLVGALVTYALYLGLWAVVRMVARGFGVVPSVLIATAVVSLLLPVLARIGFLVIGVRVSRATVSAH